jgi:hypothetical protein
MPDPVPASAFHTIKKAQHEKWVPLRRRLLGHGVPSQPPFGMPATPLVMPGLSRHLLFHFE